MIAIKNILVATDFSAPSEAALFYGKDFARTYGAALHVLHVVDDVGTRVVMAPMAMTPDVGTLQVELEAGARQALDDLLTDEDRRVLHARPVLRVSSQAADTIVSYARDAEIDLIIIGTHGRTGLTHFFMGSVAQHVVRMAPCPVLTVRHPEREFVRPDALQTTTAAR
jgi:nucleotide-binding universal stress UspA family protein